MKQSVTSLYFFLGAGVLLLTQCSEAGNKNNIQEAGFNQAVQVTPQQNQFGGFESQIKYGEHLVLIAGCHDCHTPKKMTEKGPEFDFSRALSGHPAKMPSPDIDRKEIETKGLAVTQTLTSWVGPWGISYAANLTSDKTGIGNWQEKNFITAIREGKSKGIPNGRKLLPPMPWEMYKNMTDEELKAVFAYLKSTKPISNTVPPPQPPVTAVAGK
jgi:mono/diheme cytochrome c family protein